MPERLIPVAGTPAEIRFADGSIAGTLAQISDVGFELVRRTGETVLLPFRVIDRITDGRVILVCNEGDLDKYVA